MVITSQYRLSWIYIGILFLFINDCTGVNPVNVRGCTHQILNEPGNYTDKCSLVVEEGMLQAKLNVELHLISGYMAWLLRDPYGIIRAEGYADIESNHDFEEHVFYEPTPGIWKLEYRFINAVGEFYTPWTVQ